MSDEAARAEAAVHKAEALKVEYEKRLQLWPQERAQAQQALEQEIAQERVRWLDALKKTLADETAKAQARAEALNEQRDTQLVRHAMERAFAQVASMLKRLADPALTSRIVSVAAEDLSSLSETQRAALHTAAASLGADATVEISVAHPLDAAAMQALTAALEQAVGKELRKTVTERPELIAGVRISLGERLLQANLAEELAFFASGVAAGSNANA